MTKACTILLSGSTKDILKPKYNMGKAKEAAEERLYGAPHKALSSNLYHAHNGREEPDTAMLILD